ncbi:hypothetical protein GWK47_024514 [Chionoecetes opilio]|uniref:Uncharacterized protein n=1 Tax=Chionoecetes opilio TaxID=41210 RepID=A0A8J4XL00_CHIOP|nr:hypothetical protein GWK47_024514 [Chionoecetes opilio]
MEESVLKRIKGEEHGKYKKKPISTSPPCVKSGMANLKKNFRKVQIRKHDRRLSAGNPVPQSTFGFKLFQERVKVASSQNPSPSTSSPALTTLLLSNPQYKREPLDQTEEARSNVLHLRQVLFEQQMSNLVSDNGWQMLVAEGCFMYAMQTVHTEGAPVTAGYSMPSATPRH